MAFGLVISWSLVPQLFPQQLFFYIIGLLIFFLVSRIDFRIFPNLSIFLFVCTIIALLSTYIFGEATRGSTRWIQIGTFTLQSSELVKPLLILFFASYFSKQEDPDLSVLIKAVLYLAVPLLMVFKQPDLGSSLVIGVIFVGMYVSYGLTRKQFIAGFLGLLTLLPIGGFFLKDYQKTRIFSFLDPYLDPLGSGYNLIQAVITVGSGQLFGKGLGRGTQSHLAFLPEKHTDFVFASFSEEFGFLGAGILLILYAIILYRLMKIAQQSNSLMGSFLAIGVFSMLIFQIFVNIGMNLGILPITGITLPLMSYGGSSILAVMICLGLAEAVANFKRNEDIIEIK
jgi:rod shape determining protein RodA